MIFRKEKGVFLSLFTMNCLKEIYEYREMVVGLVRRDLKGRYKGSALGFLWTFLNPLLQLGVYTFVFSIVLPNNIDKYYLHLFVALVPWIFFSTCLASGSACIWSQQDLVKKIYFPREVLPLSFVISQFVNMLLSFVVVFIVLIATGVGIHVNAVIYLPIIMLVEFILCLSITMITSAVTVYIRDLEYILGILAMALQFLTPVMYPMEQVPERFRTILMLNPMAPIIVAYRDILYYKQVPHIKTLLMAFLLGGMMFIVGWNVFGKLKRHFVEEL